ncbi:hypothetical protein, partial [Methylobacterium oxalidis]|uniref:hypothetical protein n=1 Tax=Methylobacterium oxalidis TaxID=944322 RepID=UPI0024E0AA66
SESQNRSAIAASTLQTAALNHETTNAAIAWFGSHPKTDQFSARRTISCRALRGGNRLMLFAPIQHIDVIDRAAPSLAEARLCTDDLYCVARGAEGETRR